MLAVTSALLAGCSTINAMFADDRPQKAYEALSAKDYVTAEKLYGDILKDSPKSPWATFNLGAVYQSTNRVAQAKAQYQNVVDMNATDQVGTTTDGKGGGMTLTDLAKQRLAALK